MKAQFEILGKLLGKIKTSNDEIERLKNLIAHETGSIKSELLTAYDHDADVMFLVEFTKWQTTFYKATKDRLYEVDLFYGYGRNVNDVTDYDGAVKRLTTNILPKQSSMSSYKEFGVGLSDELDAHGRLVTIEVSKGERIEWITDKTIRGMFLYEVTEEEYLGAIEVAADCYR